MLSKIHWRKGWLLVAIGAILWFCLHIPSIQYGTKDVPLYITYIGDEQVPVNGALHVLKEKSIFALRDANKAYYGPLMIMIAVPPVILDYVRVSLFEGVNTALQYRDYVVWNWGGILSIGRLLAVAVGFLGLYFFAKILLLKEFNNRKLLWPVLLMTILLATEYFYFHYTAHFRHWVFLNTILLGQIYLYFLMSKNGFNSLKLWSLQASLSVFTFGISYLGVLFQVVWSLHLFGWLRRYNENRKKLKNFIIYTTILSIGSILIILWHPYAFFRIVGIVGADLVNDNEAIVLEEDYGSGFSFDYYTALFLNNHLAFSIGSVFVILMFLYWRKQINYRIYAPVLLLLLSYILLFGFKSHHSTHYFLPAIVLIHLLVGLVFVKSVNERVFNMRSYLIPIAVFFFGAQLAFNISVLYKLVENLKVLPPDLILAEQLLKLQEVDGGRVLLSGCGPLGVPHTREAYEDFASRAERYKTSLYSTILSSGFPFPNNVTLLDAYYDDNMPEGVRLDSEEYERVVMCHPFNPTGKPNLRLLHETKLINYWNLEAFSDKYVFLLPTLLNGIRVEGISFK